MSTRQNLVFVTLGTQVIRQISLTTKLTTPLGKASLRWGVFDQVLCPVLFSLFRFVVLNYCLSYRYFYIFMVLSLVIFLFETFGNHSLVASTCIHDFSVNSWVTLRTVTSDSRFYQRKVVISCGWVYIKLGFVSFECFCYPTCL